jgi:hypothetical protein
MTDEIGHVERAAFRLSRGETTAFPLCSGPSLSHALAANIPIAQFHSVYRSVVVIENVGVGRRRRSVGDGQLEKRSECEGSHTAGTQKQARTAHDAQAASHAEMPGARKRKGKGREREGEEKEETIG